MTPGRLLVSLVKLLFALFNNASYHCPVAELIATTLKLY